MSGVVDVALQPSADGATLVVRGDLDMAMGPVVIEKAAPAIASHDRGVLTVDMAAVDFCDSAGINALVSIRKLCDQHGWQLKVANLRPPVRRVVEITGLLEHLGVV